MALNIPSRVETPTAAQISEWLGRIAMEALHDIRAGNQAVGEAAYELLRPLAADPHAAAAWKALALLQRRDAERAYGVMVDAGAGFGTTPSSSFGDAVHALTLRATGRTGWEPLVERVMVTETEPRIRSLAETVRQWR